MAWLDVPPCSITTNCNTAKGATYMVVSNLAFTWINATTAGAYIDDRGFSRNSFGNHNLFNRIGRRAQHNSP